MRPRFLGGWFLISVLALAPRAASAHDADIVYARLERSGPTSSEVREQLTLTAATLALLAPIDADGDGQLSQADLDARSEAMAAGVWAAAPLSVGSVPCSIGRASASLKAGYVELAATFECPPGELQQVFRLLSVLPSGYRVVLGSQLGEAQGQQFAEGNQQTLILHDPASPPAHEAVVSGLRGWIQLGMSHIFSGFDHLAFLVALLLVGSSWKKVLGMVTAFTLAHSITLGVTALGLVVLSPAWQRAVEAAIALSIIWVAIENLAFGNTRHRPAITFGFGLIHGFGFAAALRGYGLGASVPTALFGFNVGVELGQGCVVAVVYPLLHWLRRTPRVAELTIRAGSLAILMAGGYWLVDRLLG